MKILNNYVIEYIPFIAHFDLTYNIVFLLVKNNILKKYIFRYLYFFFAYIVCCNIRFFVLDFVTTIKWLTLSSIEQKQSSLSKRSMDLMYAFLECMYRNTDQTVLCLTLGNNFKSNSLLLICLNSNVFECRTRHYW